MPPDRQRQRQRATTDRALDVVGRGARIGIAAAGRLYGRWRRAAPAPPALSPAAAPAPRPAQEQSAVPPRVEPPAVAEPPSPDVSEIEVRDLRADLARELERLAGTEIP